MRKINGIARGKEAGKRRGREKRERGEEERVCKRHLRGRKECENEKKEKERKKRQREITVATIHHILIFPTSTEA